MIVFINRKTIFPKIIIYVFNFFETELYGATKMYQDLKKVYWWPAMKKEVAQFVSACEVCQRVKLEHQKPAGMLNPLSIPEWILGEEVYKYIREQKINILGEPLPNEEKQEPVDFVNKEDFTFVFDVALAPEFDAKISDKDSLDYRA